MSDLSPDGRQRRAGALLCAILGAMDYSTLALDGLILVSRIRPLMDGARMLRRDVDRGILVHLRRGAFVERAVWDASSARQRHVFRVRATIAELRRPVAAAGISAAAVWGMPVEHPWPDEVTVIDEWHGGGRSEPGVRRTTASARTATIQTVNGVPAVSLARTALMVASRGPFHEVVGSVDWALWRKNSAVLSRDDLLADLETMSSRTPRRHVLRTVRFGTHLSDSFGESKTRAVIHLLGFAPPELQVEFRDEEEMMMPDYFWREVMQVGEFDGKVKYSRNSDLSKDPSEVVWREKRREDRLRRQGCGVTRMLTEHVVVASRLERLLTQAGIPRIR